HDDRHQTAAVATFRPAVASEPRPARKRYLAALAIPALLAIGIAPALWERAARAHNSGGQPIATSATASADRRSEPGAGAAAVPAVNPPAPQPSREAAVPPTPAAAPSPAPAASEM